MNKKILELTVKVAETSLKIVEIYDGDVIIKSSLKHYEELGRRQKRHIAATRRLKRALKLVADQQRKKRKRG